MLLIAHTSPLISLIIIDRIGLLKELFTDYWLPKAVWNELDNHNELKTYSTALSLLSSHVRELESKYLLLASIDISEAEAMLLYKELKAMCFD
jgi:predicted nucleic acid-binding protein